MLLVSYPVEQLKDCRGEEHANRYGNRQQNSGQPLARKGFQIILHKMLHGSV